MFSGTLPTDHFNSLLTEESAREPAANDTTSVSMAGAGRLKLLREIKQAAQLDPPPYGALLLVAVDGFSALEGRLGYHDAELTMAELMNLLRPRLGPQESLFRFSPSELALVVSLPTATGFEVLAEGMREDAAAQLYMSDEHETNLTVTVVAYPLSAHEQAEKVLESVVDEARRLSGLGGNRIAVLGPTAESTRAAQGELRKSGQVCKALQENRIELAFQPITSLEGDGRQHFDLLARMRDEAGGLILARDFIPTAEKSGLITTVDRWMVSRALHQLAQRHDPSETSSLFVRLSEQTIKDGAAFYKWFAEALIERPLAGDELVFLIQQSLIEIHVAKTSALCKMLRSVGAGIALDHFGVGNNSARMLEHVPAEFVRFHYSFSGDFVDPVLQKKLAGLIEITRQRSARTIMAQVKGANAMARLWLLGVNYVQMFQILGTDAVDSEPSVIPCIPEQGRVPA